MRTNVHNDRCEEAQTDFFGNLTRCPLLTSEEEISLTRAVQNGDIKARAKLVESNMRLVIAIAKGFRNRALPVEDLIQEGALGLIQAAERFDPDRGFRFSTYASHWIRQAIWRAIESKAKAIRVPAHIRYAIRRYEKAKVLLSLQLGREPSSEELAEEMGLNLKRFYEILQASHEMLSLDNSMGDRTGLTYMSLIREGRDGDSDDSGPNEQLVEQLHSIMATLSEREQRVLYLRFIGGEIIDPEDVTKEMEKELKLSRERLRQIEVIAIKKLKALAMRRGTLSPTLNEAGA